MALYGFKNKDAALALRTIGENLVAGNSDEGYPTGMEQMIVKSPSGGIDARAGDTCGEGVCTMVVIDGTDFLEIPSIEVPVLNSTTEAVAADTYVSVSRVGVHWVVSGGAGGSASPNYLCKAPVGGVPARTGNDASQTSCDTYEINNSTGAITATGSTVNIFNVWSQSIASSAYFTAKQIDGVWVPDAEDCTGN